MLERLRDVVWRESIGMVLCMEVVHLWSVYIILGMILLSLRRHCLMQSCV
jgi:hypothetical protein